MRVKICGLTRPEDAALAEAAGADAIGLIFAPSSKRQVTLAQALEVTAALGPLVTRVGVFRDQPLEEVQRVAGALRLDAVQLHGREDAAYAAALREGWRVIKAVAFSAALARSWLEAFPADAFLLDGLRPGSGAAFDWGRAAWLKGHPRLILAGGLTAENAAEAARALEPYALDVASGVESAPGVKDPEKVRRFVAAAKGALAPQRSPDTRFCT